MANATLEAGSSPAPKSLVARFFGIITSPRATYESVVAHPRWFGMLAVATLGASLLIGGFLMTQVGQDAMLVQMQERAGGADEQRVQAMEKMLPMMGYFYAAGMLVFIPVFYIVVSGLLWVVMNATMGGDASFKKLFTVCVHAAPIGILGQAFTVPLNYARGAMTSATNLAVLLPMFEEGSFAASFFGAIDLFLIWQLFVLAIGLAVLYRRRTQPIATMLFVIYGVIALIIAVVKAGS